MDFSKSLMPEKSLQVTRLRLVTWKDFSGIRDLEKSILALPHHRIGPVFSGESCMDGSSALEMCVIRESNLGRPRGKRAI